VRNACKGWHQHGVPTPRSGGNRASRTWDGLVYPVGLFFSFLRMKHIAFHRRLKAMLRFNGGLAKKIKTAQTTVRLGRD